MENRASIDIQERTFNLECESSSSLINCRTHQAPQSWGGNFRKEGWGHTEPGGYIVVTDFDRLQRFSEGV